MTTNLNTMKLDKINSETAFNYKYLLRRMLPYIKPLTFRILTAFFLAIPLGLLDGITAFMLKPYIDVVVNGENITYFNDTLTRDFLSIIIPPGIIFFAGVQGMLRYLNVYLADWIS
ncbi:MAG: hypothetical protein IKR34_01045, partial [Candidatus Gastranaerophilales bacterium]|nr:hypothetical protein [Candidatus Gastranaerophilales bacterium]